MKRRTWPLLVGSVLLGACLIVVLFSWRQTGKQESVGKPTTSDRTTGKPKALQQPMPSEEAKRVIADFAASAKFYRPGAGSVGLVWPKVTDQLCRALDAIKDVNDPDVNADLAAIFVRYQKELSRYGDSGLWTSAGDPLTQAFFSAVKPELPYNVQYEGAFASRDLARWICKNRAKLGKSATLDREIEEYKRILEKPEVDPDRDDDGSGVNLSDL